MKKAGLWVLGIAAVYTGVSLWRGSFNPMKWMEKKTPSVPDGTKHNAEFGGDCPPGYVACKGGYCVKAGRHCTSDELTKVHPAIRVTNAFH